MKVLILDGSDRKTSEGTILELLMQKLKEKSLDCEILTLSDMKVHYCAGCFNCWQKTPGKCTTKDDAEKITRAMINSDIMVYFTPITFGGYSSTLKKALDRQICLISPYMMTVNGETHHVPRYNKFPALLAVGLVPQHNPTAEQIFTTLIERNALNMHTKNFAVVALALNESEAEHGNQLDAVLKTLGA